MPRSRSSFVLLLVAAAALATAPLVRSLTAVAQQPPVPTEGDAGDDGPTELQIHRTRAIIAWKQAAWAATPESLNETIRHLERARAAGGMQSDSTVNFLLGYAYLMKKRPSEALPLLNAARDTAQQFVGFDLIQGMRLEDGGQHLEAIAALDRFLERQDDIRKISELALELEFLGLLHRGQSLLGAGKVDRAIEDFEQALEKSYEGSGKASAAAKVLLARANVQAEQFSVAEALLMEVVAADPDEAANYYHLGVVFADQQQLAKSRHWYSLAIRHQPGYAKAYLKLAYISKTLDDLKACRRHLETFAALTEGSAENPRPADQTADVEAGFGQYWEAVGNARSDFNDDPGATEAYERAIVHFRGAVKARPDCMSAITKLIELLFLRAGSEVELEALKKQLEDLKKLRPGGAEVERSTFC